MQLNLLGTRLIGRVCIKTIEGPSRIAALGAGRCQRLRDFPCVPMFSRFLAMRAFLRSSSRSMARFLV